MKIPTSFLLLATLLMAGCQQHSRLTDNGIQGTRWSGPASIGGTTQNVTLEIIQKGNEVGEGYGPGDNSMLNINYGITLSARVVGDQAGNTFTLTGDEGTLCTNKWALTGNLVGPNLVVTLTGTGNNVPGTHCYAQPLNLTMTLSH